LPQTNPDDFQGYAHVHADDPRIMVTARVFCRDGLGIGANVVSDYQVASYPVGASMGFFLARTPRATAAGSPALSD
jgi:hypothetical protein